METLLLIAFATACIGFCGSLVVFYKLLTANKLK